MMKKLVTIAAIGIALSAQAQDKNTVNKNPETRDVVPNKKAVIYQVFTRLFGNKNSTNKPWGTIAENGVGKFDDFTDKALVEIRDLGATHIWYTGVPHHAVINDYTNIGISNDDPDVVKGRAGSPYAVKDYYNVNPDLAVNPEKRLEEFEALIERTHKNGLKVIIDIVPNHVARNYESKSNPNRVNSLGSKDDKTVEYQRDNNFYYIPGQSFVVPNSGNYKPLNGESNPLSDGKFAEDPAKWTGNGSRKAQPDSNDWYETVKINYGIRPDGIKDFPELPAGYDQKPLSAHYDFWKNINVPDSWGKFREITYYWLAKGVDGFRFDMAEMVPVEFWSYLNSGIKKQNPDAFLIAEVYNPKEYRNYIKLGKMDYLYDKVELYDKLKEVVQGKSSPDGISDIQNGLKDIERHMLHFLDNHDEQRLASPEFAGSAEKGKPLMVVSATIGSSPTMIYFGQEVGEPGKEDAGFGKPSRTSIFDYIGVPHHQRWMNDGKFDGGKLTPAELSLRDFYKRLLNFSTSSYALLGEYREIQTANRKDSKDYGKNIYSFVRWSDSENLVIISNFSATDSGTFDLKIPSDVIGAWGLGDGSYTLRDQLYNKSNIKLEVKGGEGKAKVIIAPLESFIYKLK